MRYLRLALVLLLSSAAAAPVRTAAQAPRPKLVVILVADQMRTDYLTKYEDFFEGGLKRLTTEGAWFKNGAYPYTATLTCVGHTTIATGTLPYRHGIIQNAWWDRASGKSVTCTEDAEATEVSYGTFNGVGDSARRMLAPSLAETLKKNAKGRSIAIAIKPRSAIGLAGHDADAVIWLDERGAWGTSSAYAAGKAGWAAAFIAANPITRDAGKVWERTLPVDRYKGADDAPGEGSPRGWTKTFPHALGVAGDAAYVAQWITTPYADEYIEQMAEAAIDENKLGQGEGVDFLGVSFSTLDLIGHAYGPRSHEVQDELVRLDRTIGKLLAHLDAKVGAGNYVLALSADHGVAEIPDQVEGAGRVVGGALRGAIDAVLKPAGYGEGSFVAAIAGSDIYLVPGAYERLRGDSKTLKALMETMTKLSGVDRVITADEVNDGGARKSKDAQIRATALSYFAGRSGDLIVIPKENWIVGASITTHGTPNEYDQRVPVIFFGAGVRPGTRAEPATPADIAPTLAAIAGVQLGGVDGKVLTPALKK